MSIKLSQREKTALEDIVKQKGRYSRHWTPKTNLLLQEKGLVRIDGDNVLPTDKALEICSA